MEFDGTHYTCHGVSMTPTPEIAADLSAAGAPSTQYDVVLIGNADATEPAPATIPQYESAGVNWLLVQAFTLDDARDRIRRGPPS